MSSAVVVVAVVVVVGGGGGAAAAAAVRQMEELCDRRTIGEDRDLRSGVGDGSLAWREPYRSNDSLLVLPPQ